MASSAEMKLALVALMCIVVVVPVSQAITCGQVMQNATPCIRYITCTGGSVPATCCNGVRNVKNMAKTTANRKQACICLTKIARSIPGLNEPVATGLPGVVSAFPSSSAFPPTATK